MEFPSAKKNFISPISETSQHTAFEVVLLILVCGLFYFFIISPKARALDAVNTRYDQLSEESSKLTENKNKLQKAISDMNSHPDQVAALDEALPLDNRITKLHIALSNLTVNSGMAVGDISIGLVGDQPMAGNVALLESPYTAERQLQKLTTQIDVTGTFEQFQSLLKKIESSGRLINIKSVNIHTAKEADSLDFKISLEAYYYE